MKNINLKSILVSAFVLLVSLSSQAQISKAEIIATGLTCSMCSNAINKQLKSMAEVENVSTDLNTNTFTVTLKENNKLTPNTLKESIEKTGFFIGSMVLTVDLGNSTITESQKIEKQSGTYVFVNGPVKVQVLNDGFVTKKEFKKSAKLQAKYADALAQANTYLIKSI
jgi:copper chaperone CopZ